MKGKKLLPIITLALISLVACNSQAASSGEQSKASSQEASQQTTQSQASASQSQSQASASQTSGSQSQAGAHTHDMEAVAHTKGEGEVEMDVKKCKEDAYYEASWSATDAAVVTTTGSGYNAGYKNGKFGVVGDAAEFKIWVPVAMNARLYARGKYNSANIKGIDSSEHHTVWYDWRSDHDGFKLKITLNGTTEIDQGAQTVKVGDQDVALKDLNFNQIEGYTKSDSEVLEFPWVNIQLNEGVNTIKFERTHGYGHTYERFILKANI